MVQPQGSVSIDGYLGGLLMVLYKSSRRYFVVMVLSALIVGAAAYFFSPRGIPVYGGEALIRLGAVSGTAVINAETATATMNTSAFRQEVVQAAAPADARSAALIADSVTTRSDSGDLITVGVRSFDEQPARRAIDAVVRMLNVKQEKLRDPLLAELNDQAAILDDYVASLAKIQDKLASLSKGAVGDNAPPGDGASPALTATSVLDLTARNAMELRKARSEKLELLQRLGPTKTYPTAIVGDVRVSLVAGPARPWRTAALAVLITLVGFLIFALTPARSAAARLV